jgi:putative DNA primase/helicase
VEPFEPRVLPEAFRPWLEDIAERMQCPLDYPAVSAMVGEAAVIGRRVGIRPKRRDDWLVVPNLWGGVIGRPGVLKSPAIQEPLRGPSGDWNTTPAGRMRRRSRHGKLST